MIAYRAACPACGREVWWHAYPSAGLNSCQTAVIMVRCNDCDRADKQATEAKLLSGAMS